MNSIVPTEQASVYERLNSIGSQTLLWALVRPNNPPPGLAGFLLDLVEEDGSELESDITDNYTEGNIAIQDHIALRPEVVTVSGQTAELVKSVPYTAETVQVEDPLPLIPGQGPEFSPGVEEYHEQFAKTQAQQKASVVSSQSLYGFYLDHLPQPPAQTKQSLVYGYFYQLWLGRQLFSVETPWGFFTNMAIQSLAAKQGSTTRMVSDFRVTFKKIRVAKSLAIQAGQLAGRSMAQDAGVSESGFSGLQTLTPAEASNYLSKAAIFTGP